MGLLALGPRSAGDCPARRGDPLAPIGISLGNGFSHCNLLTMVGTQCFLPLLVLLFCTKFAVHFLQFLNFPGSKKADILA